jgi:WD40 repeat protein
MTKRRAVCIVRPRPTRRVVCGRAGRTVKIWNLKAQDSAEPVTLRGHAGYIHSVAFSPDGRRLASASGYADRGEIKVWDATLWENRGAGGP